MTEFELISTLKAPALPALCILILKRSWSLWSQPRIETSGWLVWNSAIHGPTCACVLLKSDWLTITNEYSLHAQKKLLWPDVLILGNKKDGGFWQQECSLWWSHCMLSLKLYIYFCHIANLLTCSPCFRQMTLK